MSPQTKTVEKCTAMETKRDGRFLSNYASRLMAAEVFKLPGSNAFQRREIVKENDADAAPQKSYDVIRKIGAHIKNKSEKERADLQRGQLAKIGEPLTSDCVRINNNISLHISNHTSRHSRYADDLSTGSDNDLEDSFCNDDSQIDDGEEMLNSQILMTK